MVLIPFRDGKVVLCQEQSLGCPLPCGVSVTWTPCNRETIVSGLTGLATYALALDVQFFTLCYGLAPGLPGQFTDLFWIVANATQDEIQEPGGDYVIPVPELAAPAAGMCRFVWRIFTGRGSIYTTNFDPTTAAATSTPTSCEKSPGVFSRYAWIAYADVNKCSAQVAATGIVLDDTYDFDGWPENDPSFGCACDLRGTDCDEVPPSFNVASYFAPDCCV